MLWQIRQDDCGTIVAWRLYTKRFFENFFFSSLGQGFSHILSRAGPAKPLTLSDYTSPSTPTPLHQCPYQRLSVVCGQMKGKMRFLRRNKNEKLNWKRKKMQASEVSGNWGQHWVQAMMEPGHYEWNKKPVSPHNSTRLEYSTLSWEKGNLLTKNEVLHSFRTLPYTFLCQN